MKRMLRFEVLELQPAWFSGAVPMIRLVEAVDR
jgi:hypothetical protein